MKKRKNNEKKMEKKMHGKKNENAVQTDFQTITQR
jgi:hypothetical protein